MKKGIKIALIALLSVIQFCLILLIAYYRFLDLMFIKVFFIQDFI